MFGLEETDKKRLKYIKYLLGTNPEFVLSENEEKDNNSQTSLISNYINKLYNKDGKIRTQYSQRGGRGRFYASTPSVQGLNKKIRGFLCRDYATDIDIKNCYPVILKKICDRYSIICPTLGYYVEKREIIFDKYPTEKEVIKNQIFRCIFGETVSPNNEFVRELKKEIVQLREKLHCVPNYSEYLSSTKNKKNEKGSATFKIIEDMELEIVNKAIAYMEDSGLKLYTYMYDGFMIHGNHYNNSDLLINLNKYIKQYYPEIDFVYKEHADTLFQNFDDFNDEGIDMTDNSMLSYEEQKVLFEQKVSKIVGKSFFVVENKKEDITISYNIKTKPMLNIGYENLHAEPQAGSKNTEFLPRWYKDSKMRSYEDIGVFPPGVNCPRNTLNTWTPFKAEYIKEHVETPDILERILRHIKILCGNDDDIYDYMIGWIAHLLQYPSEKSRCPVFISKQGAGKGTFLEFLREILGSDKVFETTSPDRDVWGSFNGCMVNSYLVGINELAKKQQTDYLGKIKGLITDLDLTINQKGIEAFPIKSYHKFVITTNSEDPVYVSQDCRRYVIVRSSDELIGNTQYFTDFHNYIKDPNVIRTCYDYFMNHETKKTYLSVEPKITEYHENLIESNIPVLDRYMEYVYRINEKEKELELSIEAFYAGFVNYTKENGIKYETNSHKLICSLRSSKFKECTHKKRTNTNRFTVVIIEKLKNILGITDYFVD